MQKLEFDFIVKKNIANFPYKYDRSVYRRITISDKRLMYLIKIVYGYRFEYDGRKPMVNIPFVRFKTT